MESIALHVLCTLLLFACAPTHPQVAASTRMAPRSGDGCRVRDRARLDGASAEQRGRGLHHAAQRVDDGARLPDHDLRERARARLRAPRRLAGPRGRGVRRGHGLQGVDGHGAGASCSIRAATKRCPRSDQFVRLEPMLAEVVPARTMMGRVFMLSEAVVQSRGAAAAGARSMAAASSTRRRRGFWPTRCSSSRSSQPRKPPTSNTCRRARTMSAR